MKEKLIDREEIKSLHPLLQGRYGDALVRMLMCITGANKVNAIYDASKHLTGLDFVNDMLARLEIDYVTENGDVPDAFEGKPFITVSNHPYGHVDGIIAISAVATMRRDYKMMVNWMLSRIDTMAEHFIGVNPYAKGSRMAAVKSSIGGIKECLEHIRAGHPLGFFPAGGVSLPHLTGTEDREWRPTVLKLIKTARVPVVPMYISGNNSLFYRFLGFIDWRIRMVRLGHEVTNKRGRTVYVRFGEPILPEEQARFDDIRAFGDFLKAKTYALRKK